jgi:hypothetical protein
MRNGNEEEWFFRDGKTALFLPWQNNFRISADISGRMFRGLCRSQYGGALISSASVL